jgi:hypothetical protein
VHTFADDTAYNDTIATFNELLTAATYGSIPFTLAQTWEEVEPLSGLLQDYPGAAGAYSLRLLDAAYTGDAIRVRRSGDNAEQDIGFDGAGELDRDAIADFCSPGDGFVKVWYDQSGNGRDMEQTTTAAQGKIYDAATGVLLQGTTPSVTFTSVQTMYHSLASNLTGDMFFAGVFTKLDAAIRQDVSNDPWIRYSNGGFIVTQEPTFLYSGVTYVSGRHLATFQIKSTGATFSENGVLGDEYAGGTSVNMARFQMNPDSATYGASTNSGTSYWQEYIIYPSDQSANRAGIESNINDFYDIY